MLGAATAAYSIAVIIKPAWLARPYRLTTTGPGGDIPPEVRLMIAVIGSRDAAIGTAMVLAGDGKARRTATLCRIAADTADVVLFGRMLPDRTARRRVAVIAAGWAVLCAATLRDL
ncbi:hypothetical protein [Actinomadura sp. CNU-125]|uniref:hypothetical protein n=1 Tax=Actinomadura sp. CNU-125 TaxID=1904961 RepID=UPI0021CD0D38|nr:hypothetical protein [Actinomadura sp. CNU-125]